MISVFKKIIFLGLISSILTSCTESEFQSLTDPIVTPDAVDPVSLSFERDINTSANIDMIWVVDNSSSMKEEVQIIRDNLSRFLLDLEDRAKLNFTLITHDKGSLGLQLSDWALDRGYKQIAQFINSYDSLTQLTQLLPKMMGTSLRPNSNKVLVFVTDDNSEVSARSFFNTIARFLKIDQLKVFGFVGLDKTISPCIDRVGSHYIDMARATGGKMFNICESDWTPYFESLIKEVEKLTKTEFKLPNFPKSDLIVKVDGVEIKKYKIEGLSLIINPEVFKSNKKYKIEVSFRK